MQQESLQNFQKSVPNYHTDPLNVPQSTLLSSDKNGSKEGTVPMVLGSKKIFFGVLFGLMIVITFIVGVLFVRQNNKPLLESDKFTELSDTNDSQIEEEQEAAFYEIKNKEYKTDIDVSSPSLTGDSLASPELQPISSASPTTQLT